MEPTAHDDAPGRRPRRTFRRTLVRVMLVQVVALALLWVLQATYGG
jgi:hypothetical protein